MMSGYPDGAGSGRVDDDRAYSYGDGFEKAPFEDAAAVGQACGLQILLRSSRDVAQVEQDPLHVRIAREHG